MRSHRADDFRLPDGVRPITQRLKSAGYFTANIRTAGGNSVGTGKLDLNFVNEGPIYDEGAADWSILKDRQPFFAVVNAEENEYDIYDRQSRLKPRVEWVGERQHEQIARPETVTPPLYYPDHPVVREEWARYLNSVSGMDRRFGRVLDQLRTDGLERNTVIIFFGDNGRLEPRGIHWCYDNGLRVPMIVRWPSEFPPPRHYRAGSVDDRLISLIDVTATTLTVAGLSPPPLMQGRAFLGDEAGPPRRFVFAARDRIDETRQRIRSVHDERFHYIRTLSSGPTFASLNRYKEKCFPILPVMRSLQAAGKLSGPALELMQRTGPCEELYDTQVDRTKFRTSSRRPIPRIARRLFVCGGARCVDGGDRRPGRHPGARGRRRPVCRGNGSVVRHARLGARIFGVAPMIWPDGSRRTASSPGRSCAMRATG